MQKGSKMNSGRGSIKIEQHGAIRKMVEQVEQITFSGSQAILQGQRIIYVTERCVFVLTPDGLLLTEIAPGIDLQDDILSQMDFAPNIAHPLVTMNTELFIDARL